MNADHDTNQKPAGPNYGPPFEIYLAWSDVTLIVPESQTALSVLLAANYPIEPGCMTGSCGECLTEYVEGDIVHKDTCLNDADRQRHFCPCVSRAKTRIVIAA